MSALSLKADTLAHASIFASDDFVTWHHDDLFGKWCHQSPPGTINDRLRANLEFDPGQNLKSGHVRFGSLADIAECPINVRFTPESRL
jgi:hypothetical protein